MISNFTIERWNFIENAAKKWWTGELSGPWLQGMVYGAPSELEEPELYRHPDKDYIIGMQGPIYDFNVPAVKVVEAFEYELSTRQYLGYGAPIFWPNFGPGSLASALTETLIPQQRKGTVWFHANNPINLENWVVKFDHLTPYFRRKTEIYKLMSERWGNQIQISAPDFGGVMDVLVSFRHNENLLMDLYDNPDSVKSAVSQLHNAWFEAFDAIDSIIINNNHGKTAWDGFFFPGSQFILQCDFCAMIGPELFQEFVLPELKVVAAKFDFATYHLDGPGEIPHLDLLLKCPEIDIIQWVPTAGPRDAINWIDLYKRCLDAGKKIMLTGSTIEVFEIISAKLGVNNVMWEGWYHYSEMDKLKSFIDKHL